MTAYRRSALLLSGLLIVYLAAAAFIIDINRPRWTDEWHFVDTVMLFGEEISLSTLAHYEEMSTPAPFILYALWGRLVGFDLPMLRVLSLLIAFCTYMAFHRLAYKTLDNPRTALWVTLFLALHPYMIGLSVFVYTDMIATGFLTLGLLAMQGRNPLLLAVASAGALLSRQYLIFFTIAAGALYILEWLDGDRKRAAPMLAACALSGAPLAALALLWGGLSPDNELKSTYLQYGWGFHPEYLTLYIGQFFVYMAPIVFLRWKVFYTDKLWLTIALVLSALYIFFPVQPSAPAAARDIATVGYFHRALVMVLSNDTLVHIALWCAYAAGLPIALFFMRDLYRRIRDRVADFAFALDCAVIAYLALMPFSYLSWEKYFLPLIPILAMRMLLLDNTGKQPLPVSAVSASVRH